MNDWKKHKGFKTPEGYFEGLTGRIMDKLSEEERSIPENEGFGVPDNYFDSLDERIKDRLEPKETKVVQLHSYRRYWVAAASIAAIFLLAVLIPWKSNDVTSFDALASADIEAYLDEGNIELSSYELAEYIPEERLEESSLLEESIEEENIMDYLDDTIEDIDDLNLEYDEE